MELNTVSVVAKQSKKYKKKTKNHKNVFTFILSVFIGVLHPLNPCSPHLWLIFSLHFPTHISSSPQIHRNLSTSTLNTHKPGMEGEK